MAWAIDSNRADYAADKYAFENTWLLVIWVAEELLFDFAIFWIPLALFGKRGGRPSSLALSFLIAGILASITTMMAAYFRWVDSSCFEAIPRHEGFQILRIDECPSSATSYGIIIWVAPTLILLGSIIAILDSRRPVTQ
jgi:hypothetical protein